MSVDDAMAGRKADAGAGKFAAGVQALKGREQLAREGHVEAHAVVFDEKSVATLVGGRAELDARRGGIAGKFSRVAEQVLEQRAREGWVGVRLELVFNTHLDRPRRLDQLKRR